MLDCSLCVKKRGSPNCNTKNAFLNSECPLLTVAVFFNPSFFRHSRGIENRRRCGKYFIVMSAFQLVRWETVLSSLFLKKRNIKPFSAVPFYKAKHCNEGWVIFMCFSQGDINGKQIALKELSWHSSRNFWGLKGGVSPIWSEHDSSQVEGMEMRDTN